MQSHSSCRLCGATVAQWVRDETGRGYERCPQCDALQLASPYLPSPAEERSRYLLHDNDADNADYRRYVHRYVASSVLPYLPAGADVLDFGSGPTPMLSMLLSEEGISARSFDPFFAADRECLEGKSRYDAIVALEVLEHLHDPAREVRRMIGLLKASGLLMVRTGVFRPREGADDASERERFLQWWYRRDATHVWFLTPATIRWLEEYHALRLVHHREGDELVFQRR